MQINPISNNYNTGFNATARVHLQSGTTAKVTVKNNVKNNIKEISYEIWHKGKMLKEAKDNWPNMGYDSILQSDYFSNVCKRLELTEASDEEALSDAVFEAYIDEMSSQYEEPDPVF